MGHAVKIKPHVLACNRLQVCVQGWDGWQRPSSTWLGSSPIQLLSRIIWRRAGQRVNLTLLWSLVCALLLRLPLLWPELLILANLLLLLLLLWLWQRLVCPDSVLVTGLHEPQEFSQSRILCTAHERQLMLLPQYMHT